MRLLRARPSQGRTLTWIPHAAVAGSAGQLHHTASCLPNVIVMAVQTSIGLIETYFVAKLGLDALAGMALVFPLFMLLQMVSAGAMGGGILTAVARALGSGRKDRANELVWCAVAITIVLAALTTAAALLFGPKLYALMGGRDGSLAAADLFGGRVRRNDSVVALQFVRRDHPRHGQYVVSGRGRHRRCARSYTVFADAHFRLRAVPASRHRRRRGRRRAELYDRLQRSSRGTSGPVGVCSRRR